VVENLVRDLGAEYIKAVAEPSIAAERRIGSVRWQAVLAAADGKEEQKKAEERIGRVKVARAGEVSAPKQEDAMDIAVIAAGEARLGDIERPEEKPTAVRKTGVLSIRVGVPETGNVYHFRKLQGGARLSFRCVSKDATSRTGTGVAVAVVLAILLAGPGLARRVREMRRRS
jgi:hypothetical protein